MTTNPAPTTPPTIHYPRPAIVPARAEHVWQRRFGPAYTVAGQDLLSSVNPDLRTAIEVFRSAHEDFAEINVAIGQPAFARFCVPLTPADLRDLAARLIDAAHDIEAHPAATLAAAAREGGVA